MKKPPSLLFIFMFIAITTTGLEVSAAKTKCSDYHEGAIICSGTVYFQSNLMGEKQASCYDSPELAKRIQMAINQVQRDSYRDANGEFACEPYHDSTLICEDGSVYLSQISDEDLMNCHQVGNSSRSMQEAINQALMEAAIDSAVREAAQK
jgi:hypothetical protein